MRDSGGTQNTWLLCILGGAWTKSHRR